MPLPLPFLGGSLGLVLALYTLIRWISIAPFTSPLRHVRIPPRGHGLAGHQTALMDASSVAREIPRWTASLGKTFRTQIFFGFYHKLWTIDHAALHHILRHTETWGKPPMLRKALGRYLRSGLINMEGGRHRLVRRICQPLFSGGNIRGMMPTFWEKGEQLRQQWSDYLQAHTSFNPDAPDAVLLIDVLDSLNRLSFDIIGLTAFEHDFDALADARYQAIPYDWDTKAASSDGRVVETRRQRGEGGRIYDEYDETFAPHRGFAGFRGMAHIAFPILDKWIPTEASKHIRRGMENIEDLTRRLTRAKRAEFIEREKGANAGMSVEGKVTAGRDLLSLIVKADMTNDPEQRMTDDEIAGALATFMFAGTDTGSIMMSWCLFHLAGSPDIQARLRDECLAYGDMISMEDLDGLPLLDRVVKEVFRLNPSIPTTIREAMKDDIVPLAEPITLVSGKVVSEIKVRKGQHAYIPIEGMNWAPSVWGEDSMQFNPDRWIDRRTPASTGLGIDHDVLTFIDGPRKCLGYRMGALEIKCALFTLVRYVEFARDPRIQVRAWNLFTNRPFGLDKRFKSVSNMPIIVRQYKMAG